ncbi:MAG: hypothetical protein AAFU85_20160 [Planctomycetota bacterium]
MSNARSIRQRTLICRWLICLPSVCVALIVGCSPSTQDRPHEHAVPAHMPRNLADLAQKIRLRVERLGTDQESQKTFRQVADLIGWTAEIAADTEIGEERWNPIYELSESLRLEINEDPERWDAQRREKAARLCQLVEDAWQSLAPDDRVDRYLGHDHGHGHDHGDHDHGHDHGDHRHHEENNGDGGHDHGKDDHAADDPNDVADLTGQPSQPREQSHALEPQLGGVSNG